MNTGNTMSTRNIITFIDDSRRFTFLDWLKETLGVRLEIRKLADKSYGVTLIGLYYRAHDSLRSTIEEFDYSTPAEALFDLQDILFEMQKFTEYSVRNSNRSWWNFLWTPRFVPVGLLDFEKASLEEIKEFLDEHFRATPPASTTAPLVDPALQESILSLFENKSLHGVPCYQYTSIRVDPPQQKKN